MAKRRTASSFDSDDDQPFTKVLTAVSTPIITAPAASHRDHRGLSILDAHVACTSKGEFVREIGRLWSDAHGRFVEIGRYLLEAKARLAHGEFGQMIRNELPFEPRAANKLMVVAKAIDDGVFERDMLPPSYTTVYELVSLRPDERDLAVREQVVRPDVTRDAVVAFRRRIRGGAAPRQLKSKAAIRKRLQALEQERLRIEAEIEELRAILGD